MGNRRDIGQIRRRGVRRRQRTAYTQRIESSLSVAREENRKTRGLVEEMRREYAKLERRLKTAEQERGDAVRDSKNDRRELMEVQARLGQKESIIQRLERKVSRHQEQVKDLKRRQGGVMSRLWRRVRRRCEEGGA